MIKRFQIAIGFIITAAAFAHAQGKINYTPNKQPQDGQAIQLQQPNRNTQNNVPWVVSVVHRVDVHKLIERTRKQLKAKAGVPGSLPPYIFNFTTGMVIDDKGHIVTRLWNLDPQDKEQTISVVTNEGTNLPAKFIGLDCASGFAVLEVANLNTALPVTAGNFLKDKAVKILSVDLIQKDAANNNRTGVYVVPEIRTLTGQVEGGNVYAKERGVMTLRSASLRSKNDSAVVLTGDNQLLGIAKFAGFQRADLFPVGLIRDTIAKRVIEKQESVPAGWLGVVGMNVAQLATEQVTTFGVEAPSGVFVRDINAESPAATGGVKQGDVIVALDDFKIATTGDLSAVLSAMPAGRQIKLKARRKKEEVAINVTLGARPFTDYVYAQQFEPSVDIGASQLDDMKRRVDELQAQYRAHLKEAPSAERNETLRELNVEIRNLYDRMREISEVPKPVDNSMTTTALVTKEPIICTLQVGFTASEMTKQFADYLGAPKSLFVKKVLPKSAAEVAGLKAADVIVGSLREPLTCAQAEALFAKPQASLTLNIIRNKQPVTITLNQKQ